MSGRGGGKGRAPSSAAPPTPPQGGARAKQKTVNQIKRAPSRSPARGAAKGAKGTSSPGRGSPALRGRGAKAPGRGAPSPRDSPAARGKNKSSLETVSKEKEKKVEEIPVVEENLRKRKKVFPKISENPEAPEMEDMENLKHSRVQINGVKNGLDHSQTESNGFNSSTGSDLKPPESSEAVHIISEILTDLSDINLLYSANGGFKEASELDGKSIEASAQSSESRETDQSSEQPNAQKIETKDSGTFINSFIIFSRAKNLFYCCFSFCSILFLIRLVKLN